MADTSTPPVLDPVTDAAGQLFWRLTKTAGALPSYVTSAPRDAALVAADAPANSYGDPIRRRWPAHTKVATVLSYAYLIAQRNALSDREFTPIRQRLLTKAAFFNCTDDCLAAEAALAMPAAPPTSGPWALPATEDRPARYPLRHNADVLAAADYLVKHAGAMTFTDRTTMATNVLRRASELETVVPTRARLEKMAGVALGDGNDLAEALRKRAGVLAQRPAHAGLARQLSNMATECSRTPGRFAVEPGLMHKVASLIDTFDRTFQTGANVEQDLYSGTIGEARQAVAGMATLPSGAIYRASDVCRVPLAAMRDRFGNDIADRFGAGGVKVALHKVASAMRSLDAHDAACMRDLLQTHGVQPIYVPPEPAARMNRSTLRKLGAAYITGRAAAVADAASSS